TFAMVFMRPDFAPQRRGVGGDHAAFAASSHDFVLAERPGTDVAYGTHGAVFVAGAVCLGAILDHQDAVQLSQGHDGVHVAGPAGQVHADDGASVGGDDGGNGVGRNVLRVAVDVGKHGGGTGQHNARHRGQEGT